MVVFWKLPTYTESLECIHGGRGLDVRRNRVETDILDVVTSLL